ncbi:sulfite exporter TauE/SafE family protein [Oceanobacillus rekensis]|uniref:sulfite exporter TauE/SafE family protein n=1 Tax=Oceanobacillus rekensis TaxID=937927 RepID=UPI000B44355A|nr:sulfite exporter TauE/SafE family protein [Oceanobacillus rekensis]
MFELSIMEWAIVILCAIFIGFSKSGLPNMIILVVTALTFVFPAKESVGILLPMLLVGDIFAVTYYRRNVVWKHLITLIPWVLIGIISGYFVLSQVSSGQLTPLIGIIVLTMIVLQLTRQKFGERFNQLLPTSLWFVALMGILGGFTTIVGNAAGAVMTIYLLVKGLSKENFVGTAAWFFLSVNLIKFPFYLQLGLINQASLTFNLWMVPAIIAGVFIGIKILPLIPKRVFGWLVLGLAALGGINLLF